MICFLSLSSIAENNGFGQIQSDTLFKSSVSLQQIMVPLKDLYTLPNEFIFDLHKH